MWLQCGGSSYLVVVRIVRCLVSVANAILSDVGIDDAVIDSVDTVFDQDECVLRCAFDFMLPYSSQPASTGMTWLLAVVECSYRSFAQTFSAKSCSLRWG